MRLITVLTLLSVIWGTSAKAGQSSFVVSDDHEVQVAVEKAVSAVSSQENTSFFGSDNGISATDLKVEKALSPVPHAPPSPVLPIEKKFSPAVSSGSSAQVNISGPDSFPDSYSDSSKPVSEGREKASGIAAGDARQSHSLPLEQNKQAIEKTQKVESTAPPAAVDVKKLLSWGIELARSKKWQEARQAFEAVIRTEPENATAWCNLGLSLRHLGKPHKALNAYERALEAEPDFALAHKNLARALERTGQYAKAVASYEAYLRLNPEAKDARLVEKRAKWLKQNKVK